MASTPQAPTTDFSSTTLNGSIDDSVLTITVNSATAIQVPTYAVIDREDGNGTATSSAREVVYVSAKNGNDLTVTRGVNNSTARSHNSGALFEPIFSVGFWADVHTNLQSVLTTAGALDTTKVADLTTAQTLTNKTLTTPVINGAVTGTITPPLTFYGSGFNPPNGFIINGKIVPSVASNNLTVALKGMDGNDPSASNPIYVRIGDTVRSITAALSVTKNAGTNWMDLGGTMHATLERDLFVYLGYNATDGVVLGFARIPYARIYSDFSATSTNERYAAISTITNAAAGDNYTVIGRFAATLSATASFNWSVPTFTTINLIQRPIYKTRWMAWVPTMTCSGSMTFTSTNNYGRRFMIDYRSCHFNCAEDGTTGGTASTTVYFSVPISISASAPTRLGCAGYIYDGTFVAGFGTSEGATTTIGCAKYNKANFVLTTFVDVVVTGEYEI